jgi:hypothetical protein
VAAYLRLVIPTLSGRSVHLYLVLVGVLSYFVGTRVPAGPHTVAGAKLEVDHRLTPEDLVPADRDALLNRYLRTEVKPGEPITAAMVSERPLMRKHINAIAAIVTVPKATAAVLQLNAGVRVQICRHEQAFGGPATVAAVACGEKDCTVTLILPKMAESIDPAALTDASLAASNRQLPCDTVK